MVDQVRSEISRRERETAVARETDIVVPTVEIESDMDPDDTLILLFMCCHPALTSSSAIALTLRAVGGLTTAEIANAFLVPEATMAQRISRAKQSIKASGVPFRLPSLRERAERLPAVLHVLYLIFSEGYASSIGAHLQRLDLSHDRRWPELRIGDLLDHRLRGLQLRIRMRQDDRAILRPDIVSLPILCRWIMDGEERAQNRIAVDHGSIERDLHHLGMAGGGQELLACRQGDRGQSPIPST